ncbi:hypothetical protein AAFF_G00335790 [Aldrovandia affinis]|uniref:Uncharacterized protein n=1 Tax=Aldrovandia affinis TaxID=143900 RepID=A0AAD7SLC5_9TELE|nr:hypothetical protein AAFF_G00335790 [Aldrovandia affinis]
MAVRCIYSHASFHPPFLTTRGQPHIDVRLKTRESQPASSGERHTWRHRAAIEPPPQGDAGESAPRCSHRARESGPESNGQRVKDTAQVLANSREE